jgi:hypothetical protein
MTEPSDDDEGLDDIAEDGSWICPNACGAGGRCVKGDESLSQGVHLSQGCPNA